MNYFNEAFRQSSALMFVWGNSSDMPIISMGENVERLFGVSKDELCGSVKSLLDIFDPSERRRLQLELTLRVTQGDSFFILRPIRLKVVDLDSEVRVVLFVSPNLNNSGEIVSFTSYLIDSKGFVDDHRHMSRLAVAAEQSSSVIVITDIEGTIQYVNKQFTLVTQYSAEEVIGSNPRVLKSGRTPKETYDDLWRTIPTGNSWTGELYNKRKDGSYYWEKAIIWPMFFDGEITHYVAIKEDITNSKESECKLSSLNNILKTSTQISQLLLSGEPLSEVIPESIRLIVESTNLGCAYIYQREIDDDGVDLLVLRNHWEEYRHMSEQIVDVTCFTPDSVGWVYEQLRNGVDLVGNIDQFPEKVQSYCRLRGIRSIMMFPIFVDTHFWGVFTLSNFIDSDPIFDHDRSILRAITNNIGMSIFREKSTVELMLSKVRAERSNNMKSRFLESLQHEIKTPLNIIYGFLDLICQDDVSSIDRSSFVKIIRNSGDKLISTINDLVEISRLDSGLAVACSDILNIGEMLYMLLDEFRMEKNNRGVVIDATVTEFLLETEVNSDKEKVYAILRNILMIILKGNDSGHIELGCVVDRSEYCFTILAKGISVDSSILINLNKVKYRSIGSSMEEETIGLKLSLIKGYVDILKGYVSVVDNLGILEFLVTIPRFD
ncbi:MAG: PAS domain S-box protein [Bacteroidales bacterium]